MSATRALVAIIAIIVMTIHVFNIQINLDPIELVGLSVVVALLTTVFYRTFTVLGIGK